MCIRDSYETDDTYYIDSEYVSSGDILQKPDSSETYRVGTDTASLQGVYNINKGYAVFKQIDVLYQNEEYKVLGLISYIVINKKIAD